MCVMVQVCDVCGVHVICTCVIRVCNVWACVYMCDVHVCCVVCVRVMCVYMCDVCAYVMCVHVWCVCERYNTSAVWHTQNTQWPHLHRHTTQY